MELVAVTQQRPEHRLGISPTVVAFAELLCLALPEVARAVEREVEDNPALEHTARSGSDAVPLDRVAFMVDQPSDASRLLAEIRLALPAQEHALAELMVGSLDERGFVTEGVLDFAQRFAVDPGRVEAVLAEIRSAGPAGVGAGCLRECLLLQLDRLDCPHPLARQMIDEHLEDMAAGRYGSIARALGVSRDDVVAARDFIRARLRPTSGYSTRAHSAERQAVDIVIDEQLRVSLTEPARLGVRVAPVYAELAATGSGSERTHAREQVTRARAFMTRLEQRWETTRIVAQEVVLRQSRFVRGEPRGLQPLTRAAVARAVGVHESTVSRATRDRYARLPHGRVVAMRCLFPAAAPGPREALRDLLSDQSTRAATDAQLADALAGRGYAVARRTVAKYRADLGVAPRAQR